MGIKGLLTFLNRRKCTLDVTINSSNDLERTLETLDFIAFDINTNLHKICNEFTDIFDVTNTINDVRKRLCEEIRNTVVTALSIRKRRPTLDIFIGLDGASPPGKRDEQQKRRRIYSAWNEHLTAGSEFLKVLFNQTFETACHNIFLKLGECHDCRIRYVIDTDSQPNEGEIKCLNYSKRSNNTALIVTTDNDVVASSLMKNEKHVVVLTSYKVQDVWKQVLISNRKVITHLFNGDNDICQLYGFLLFAVFGGDYLPSFLASGTTNQMEALYGFTLDRLKETNLNLSAMLTDDCVLTTAIHTVLSCFCQLSKHRRCKGAVQVESIQLFELRIETLEKFFSDLVWVYRHYAVCCDHPGRTGFLADSNEDVQIFKTIPNVFFKNPRRIFESLNFVKIKSASDIDCPVMEDWENLETFRQFVLSSV